MHEAEVLKPGVSWLPVQGESMRPLLRPGEWVQVKWFEKPGAADLRRGELVVARGGDGDWIVHRLVGHGRMKGDAASACEMVANEQLWGTVTAIRPAAGQASLRFEWSPLDGWIAALGGHGWVPGALAGRLSIRLARGLSWLRRRSLLKLAA